MVLRSIVRPFVGTIKTTSLIVVGFGGFYVAPKVCEYIHQSLPDYVTEDLSKILTYGALVFGARGLDILLEKGITLVNEKTLEKVIE